MSDRVKVKKKVGGWSWRLAGDGMIKKLEIGVDCGTWARHLLY
jgi:hypothetical protein